MAANKDIFINGKKDEEGNVIIEGAVARYAERDRVGTF